MRNVKDKNGNPVHVSGHVKSLQGQRFGRLEVIGFDRIDEVRATRWFCKCDCGNIVSVRSSALISGRTKSCGCLKLETAKEIGRTTGVKHGMSQNNRLYRTWKNMRARCENQNNNDYCRYGGRGISVCEEWQDFSAFYRWAMENGYNESLSIERIDNNGNYCPENCKWATNTEQQRNRRKTVKLTYKGETKALSEWVEIFGLKMKTCYGRMHDYGWTNPEEILFGGGGSEECHKMFTRHQG